MPPADSYLSYLCLSILLLAIVWLIVIDLWIPIQPERFSDANLNVSLPMALTRRYYSSEPLL